MQFLSADWIVTFDKENVEVIRSGAVLFDEKIKDVGKAEELQKKYSDLSIEYQGKNSVILPGLINAHVHLEFSKNSTTLKYGNFVTWLYSVIENREALSSAVNEEFLSSVLQDMIQSGTTTIGAISSYGFDLSACAKSPMNVVYFCEAIGSKADMVDTLFSDFKSRLHEAQQYANAAFTPAVAIHSPYSVHPFLTREVLKIAKEHNLRTQAHFLESKEEKEWLEKSQGGMREFFKNFLNADASLIMPKDFLRQFEKMDTAFTHCVEADEEIDIFKQNDYSVIHCPSSNRLLNNKTIDLNKFDDIILAIGTDGLSSNISLNMFDELRNALWVHTEYPINDLSQKLLQAATLGGAQVLGVNAGMLQAQKDADMIVLEFDDTLQDEDIYTQIILHTNSAKKSYIKGKRII
jgi:cytosine/adenosine deaminase-related metal-dependent hydrolase